MLGSSATYMAIVRCKAGKGWRMLQDASQMMPNAAEFQPY